jgi:hypothetical protein
MKQYKKHSKYKYTYYQNLTHSTHSTHTHTHTQSTQTRNNTLKKQVKRTTVKVTTTTNFVATVNTRNGITQCSQKQFVFSDIITFFCPAFQCSKTVTSGYLICNQKELNAVTLSLRYILHQFSGVYLSIGLALQ